MAQADKPYTFANDNNADATQVNADFDEIYSKYNDHDNSNSNVHGVGSSGLVSENDLNDTVDTKISDFKSNELDGYEIQVDGTDGEGIINFKTE